MSLTHVKHAYFLGIGGIGMSAIARWFAAQGVQVSGYDKTPTPLTDELQREGIRVHFADDVESIDKEVIDNPGSSLIIYTPAIPADHKELNFFLGSGRQVLKRSQVLGLIASQHFTIAVAGTHGKTTTSSMVAWLLHQAGKNCTAFLGGIATNFESNLLLAARPAEQVIVVEADEYDRSFLTLFPDIAVVTSTDPDHLDIYGKHEELKRTFSKFTHQVKPDGHLLRQHSLDAGLNTANTITYSLDDGDIKAGKLRVENGLFRFDAHTPEGTITGLDLAVPGYHNVENALAAIGVARLLGLTDEQIRQGIASYKGVKRRFEYVVRSGEVVYLDDYAHHPREIEAFLTSVRALYPGKHLLAIFQPHLFTRTRDFAEGFARSLSLADEVVLLDIYPAREKPLTGVTSRMILEMLTVEKKILIPKEKVLEFLEKSPKLEVVCTVGAGDIDTLAAPIKEFINTKYNAGK